MATTAEQMAAKYPIPSYRFLVSVGRDQIAFNNVDGLEQQVVEYKDGTGQVYQMPGQLEAINITLRRGIVARQSAVYDWISSISLDRVEKKDISITLTNESGSELLVTWRVSDAFPTSLTAPSLDGSSNEVAIEELGLLASRLSTKFH
ncbi:hypothetical protein N7495_009074 [Penicillium taxi]|uniref:uncharacterized protein n=1 Tax=Penicillium taxi TaxID=168475 RepID=UPI0025456B04|nr:uncharacterized protein N7495_009074 [Penicillium taxi]KAJ5889033.1 hypothetical protein N7495_009074 [Penicillium taxi]